MSMESGQSGLMAPESKGWEARVVLTSLKGHEIPLAFKLDLPCTNNEVEYEALLLGLLSTQKVGG